MNDSSDSSCVFEIINRTLQISDNSLSVSLLCSMAGVSRSGYYAWLKAAPVREAQEEQDRKDFDLILSVYTLTSKILVLISAAIRRCGLTRYPRKCL
jgi:hypothetical protein